MSKVTREEIRATKLVQKITQDLGEEPYWVATDYYDLMWEWIHDFKFKHGSFKHWLKDQYTKASKPKRLDHLNNTIIQVELRREQYEQERGS